MFNVQFLPPLYAVRVTTTSKKVFQKEQRSIIDWLFIILHTFVGSFVQSILYYLQFRMNSFVDTSSIVPTIPLSDDIRIFLWFIKKQADIRTLPQPVKCIWPFVVSKRWVIWINLWVKATRDWSSMSDLRIFEQCTWITSTNLFCLSLIWNGWDVFRTGLYTAHRSAYETAPSVNSNILFSSTTRTQPKGVT